MSARDELADLLASVTIDTKSGDVLRVHPDGETPVFEGDHRTADALIAGGYSKPRTITMAKELDALHAKAVVLDANGTPWVCDGDMAEPWASVCEDPFGGPIWKDGRDILLPATVINEP